MQLTDWTSQTARYDYDNAGCLTNDGVNTYTWDRANRLLTLGGASYAYNGLGQRVQQIFSGQTTQYLLDVQPGLWKVLQATTGANTTSYVHGPMGIQAQNAASTWVYPIQDGLGSVRGVVNATNVPQESRFYDPYGSESQTSGSQQTTFGFTGEETDVSGLLNLRARYYNPALGVFPSLDPLEGNAGSPMSLNRYAYVQNNPVNRTDPSGMGGDPCLDFALHHDGRGYSECLKAHQLNPCPAGYYPDGTSSSSEPHCSGTYGGDLAGRLWELIWSPPPPPTPFTVVGGYIEGASAALTVAASASIGGKEIVYNFSTFQRAEFVYGGNAASITSAISLNGSAYLGDIEGFVANSNPMDSENFDTFIHQYEGPFNFSSLGLSADAFIGGGAGVIHFWTAGLSVAPPVYGNLSYISVGVGFSIGDVTPIGLTTYSPTGNNKTYIPKGKCQVDREMLFHDILTGDASPHMLLGVPVISQLLRLSVAIEADIAAESYNNIHKSCC